MAAAETTSQCEIDGRPGDDPPAQAAAAAAATAAPRVITVAAPRWNVAAASGVQDRWWVLLAVLLVFFLEWIDRALIQVALEPIKQELQLTDTQLGSVLAASGWVGFVAVMPVARLADRWPRRDVIAIALCVWAAGTVLSAFCTSFGTLCVARGVVGLGTASFYPASKSLIADFFPPEQRATAYGSMQAAWLSGYLSGMVGGGVLTSWIGWRMTFIVLGTPQILVAVLVHLTVPSANVCAGQPAATSLRSDMSALLKLRTLQTIFAGTFFLHLSASMDKFATSFYQRVHRLSVAETSTGLGVAGAAPACAALLGGVLIDKYYRRTRRPSVWMATAACLVLCSIPFHFASLLVSSAYVSLALRALGASVQAPHAVGLSSAQMAVVAPTVRATAAALYEVLYYLGESIGPVIAGTISDATGGADNPEGVRSALLIGHTLPVLYTCFVWHGRTALEGEVLMSAVGSASTSRSEKSSSGGSGSGSGSREGELQPLTAKELVGHEESQE